MRSARLAPDYASVSSTRRAALFAAAGVLFAALVGAGWLHQQGWRIVRVPAVGLPAVGGNLPSCAAMFVPGQTVQLGNAACTGSHGEVIAIPWHSCTRARRLATVDAATGAPAGFAFDGGPFTAASGELAADPRFADALDDCKR